MQIFRLWWVTNVFDLFFRDHLRLLEGPWTCDDHLQQNTTFGGQPDILLMFLHTLKTQNNNTGGKPSPNKNYQLNHSNLVVAQTPTSNRELPFKESNLCVFYDLSFCRTCPFATDSCLIFFGEEQFLSPQSHLPSGMQIVPSGASAARPKVVGLFHVWISTLLLLLFLSLLLLQLQVHARVLAALFLLCFRALRC